MVRLPLKPLKPLKGDAPVPTFPFPGLIGWAATLGSVVAYDTWAAVTGHPTMSSTLGHYLAHPILGPVLAGAWCGLSYHLLVEELLPGMLDAWHVSCGSRSTSTP